MERGPPPSRLQAPAMRANGAAPAKRGSGGGAGQQGPSGLRRPHASASATAATSAVPSSSTRRSSASPRKDTSPPRLALHELHHLSNNNAPPATTTFLRRGSGRTIATLGAHAAMTPPPSTRRRSGEGPPASTNGTQRQASHGTPLRARHGSRDAASAELLAANKIPPTANKKADPRAPSSDIVVPTPLSPEDAYLRQRKRSADMMDPQDPAFRALAHDASQLYGDEVDEPPMATAANGGTHDAFALVATGPLTPPPPSRAGNGAAHDAITGGAIEPLSPRDPKRQKRLTRSPKTPLGLSTYESEEGGLSATQRVRLSLSGYMTVAGLTGAGSARSGTRRESGTGSSALDTTMLLSNGDAQGLTAASPDVLARPRPKSASRVNESTASLARSKFAASRSMSGPQMASALLAPKNAVDCLMGYIRELQRSEAMLRDQLEKIRKQRHDELSRSTVRVTTLENTLTQVESERERECRELEEQRRMVEALTAEVAELHQALTTQQPMPYHSNGSAYDQDGQAQWAANTNGAAAYDGHPGVSSNGLPASSYVTPPPSGSGRGQFLRTQQQLSGADEVPATMQTQDTAWTDEQASYYQSQGHYQYQDPSTMPPADDYAQVGGPWPGHSGGTEYYQYEQDSGALQTEDLAQPNEWTDQPAPYNGNEGVYDAGVSGSAYPAVEPPMVPMSPVAKLNATWSPQDSKGVQLQAEAAPPMFRVAPRLSDIISPLSRSVIAATVTTDHNVLKPVTPQALSNPKQPRAGESTHNAADQAFMMTPSPLGPPAFSMSGFCSGSDRESTPPPSFKAKRQVGGVPNVHTNPVPDHVPGQEEQFVPAEQVFKSFQKNKTPKRKTSTTPSKASLTLSKEALKASLIEFFTAVDKTKLRMVEGYSRRYQGEEAKLLSDLTKKYGAQKVAELKRTFENASKLPSSVENDLQPVNPEQTMEEVASTPPLTAPSPVYTPPVQAPETDSYYQSAEGWAQAPASYPTESAEMWAQAPVPMPLNQETVDQPLHASLQHLMSVPPPLHFDESAAISSTPVDQVLPSTAVSHATVDSTAPPLASPLSQEVSPDSARRGPPLPFAFEDSLQSPHEETAPEMRPPPEVVVSAPLTMMAPPPLPPRSPMRKAAPSPPRIAPSPPRAPPPTERSPARHGSVLRPRVSPQRQHPPLPSAVAAQTLGAPPMQPPRRLQMNATPSTPKPSTVPVTLEGLLLEFYRKQQPDHVKNVPELIKLYTGKERELISLLKKKYGALSVKRLEQNVEILEQQSSAAGVTKTGARPSPATKTASKGEKKAKSRGCLGKIVLLVLKLILIRVVVTLVLFGGLVVLDHTHCQQDKSSDEGTRADDGCLKLSQDVELFKMSHITEYVQRVESRECFCQQWRLREARVSDEPSVGHALDLVKLVPFSRTIAEPAWLSFVDKYLPDLPYSEYYRSYARPAFLVGKDYALVGVEHVREGYKQVVNKMPEMPWQEAYESHGRPMITAVYQQVSALPWNEYYEQFGKPAIEVSGQYAVLALNHVGHACKVVSVAMVDQWTLLVEMYNEEGGATATHGDSAPGEGSKVMKASVDALTKAAKASKSLAEPHEVKDEKASAVPSTEHEVPPSLNDESDNTYVVDSIAVPADAEPSHSAAAPVEVSIEQAGLDLSYSGHLDTNAEGSEADEPEASSPSASERVDVAIVDSATDHLIVEEKVAVDEATHSASEVYEAPEETYETVRDIELVDKSVPSILEQSQLEPAVTVADSPEHSLHDDVVVLLEETEQGFDVELVDQEDDVDHASEAMQAPISDVAPAELMDATESEEATVYHSASESLDADVNVNTAPLAEIASDQVGEDDPESPVEGSVVSVSAGDSEVATHTETVDVMETGEVVVPEEDESSGANEEHASNQWLDGDQTASEANSSPVTAPEEKGTPADADHAEEEDLSFLEDMDGLDPLELLDLADMAAAQLHSIN